MLNYRVLIKKLLKINQDLLKMNLKTFDSGYFMGKSHFGEDGTQII